MTAPGTEWRPGGERPGAGPLGLRGAGALPGRYPLPRQVTRPPERVRRDVGLLAIEGTIDAVVIAAALAETRARITLAEALLAERHPGIAVGRDAFAMTEVSSRGGERFDLLFAAGSEASRAVERIAWEGPWVPLIRGALGEDAKCMCGVVYSRPGAPEQAWHADGGHLSRVADWAGAGAAGPYAVCVFVPLIDLGPEVGFTQFWPGSHQTDGLVGFGAAAELVGATWDGMMPAGSAVLYDYRCAGGPPRPAA